MPATHSGKYGHYNVGAVMSFSEIGERLHMPATTAFSLFKRGIKKLAQQPDALEALLRMVQIAKTSERVPLHAGSLECNREWCELHSYGSDDA